MGTLHCYGDQILMWFRVRQMVMLKVRSQEMNVYAMSLHKWWKHGCVYVHMFVHVCGRLLQSCQGELQDSLLLCQHLLPTRGNRNEKLSRCWCRTCPADWHPLDSLCSLLFLIIISQGWRSFKGRAMELVIVTHLLCRSTEVRISGWTC